MAHLQTIEATIKCKLTRKKVPTLKDAQAKKQEKMYNELAQAMDEGKYNDYQNIALHLLEEYEASDILAAALEMLGGESNREHEVQKIKLTAERRLLSSACRKKAATVAITAAKAVKIIIITIKRMAKRITKISRKTAKIIRKRIIPKKITTRTMTRKITKKAAKKAIFWGNKRCMIIF